MEDKIPRRKLKPSPITLFAFGLAAVVYIVFVSFVANLPPMTPRVDFVDNDVATRLVRTLYRVHDRTVDSICVLDVDLARALDEESLIDISAMDPEVALEDFAGFYDDPEAQTQCLEDSMGSLH
jgi:hypothetical protein